MRSTYPPLSLQSAIRLIEKNKTDVLRSGMYKRENLLPILGFTKTSGAGQSAIVSLMHYGFIANNKKSYYFTSSAKKVASNTSHSVDPSLLMKALLYTSIFKEFFDASQGNSVSSNNDILKKYNVPASKSAQVVNTFLKSLEYASSSDKPSGKLDEASSLNPSHDIIQKDSVSIDFGNGMFVSVPKRIILDAYLLELQKIQKSLL